MNVFLMLLALIFSGFSSAATLKNIVVFGDSLSDNGNLYEYMQHQIPQSPPYYEGRFSNGPIWVERLAEMYFPGQGNTHLMDYAFGGAGISENPEDDDVLFTLKREIDSYLLAHQDKADSDSLFVVWIGANNYLGLIEDIDIDGTVATVNQGIKHSLQRLANAGAKHILVVNLPDLGKTPAARIFDAEVLLSTLATRHNQTLAMTMQELQQNYKATDWILYDVNSLLNGMLTNPQQYGFSNTQDTCFTFDVEQFSTRSVLKIARHLKANHERNCDEYLFFDPVHPTAAAHQLMAKAAQQLLEKSGIHFKN